MVHEGIFATEDEIKTKAGEHVDSTGATEARINAICLQVESFINVFTLRNWSDDYAGLNADVKGILSEIESNLVAMYLIEFNMSSGYAGLAYAQTMLDVLDDRANKGLQMLKDYKQKDFVDGET